MSEINANKCFILGLQCFHHGKKKQQQPLTLFLFIYGLSPIESDFFSHFRFEDTKRFTSRLLERSPYSSRPSSLPGRNSALVPFIIIAKASDESPSKIHREITKLPQNRPKYLLLIDFSFACSRCLHNRFPHSLVGVMTDPVYLPNAIGEGVAGPRAATIVLEIPSKLSFSGRSSRTCPQLQRRGDV